MDELEEHSLAILDSWNWPPTEHSLESGNESKFKAITTRFLSCLIVESQKLGGTVLKQFWYVLGKCDPKIEANSELKRFLSDILTFCTVQILKLAPAFISLEQTEDTLFKELDREKVNFTLVLKLASECYTHLGVACTHPPPLPNHNV